MATENGSESIQATEATQPLGFFGRFGGTYTSPRATFQDIGRSPRLLMPMIALIVMGMVLTYLVSQKADLQSMAVEQMVEQQVARGNMTQQQADQLRERVGNRSTAGSIVSTVFGGLSLVVVALIIAAVAKFISSTFLSVENSFKSIFSVTLYVSLAVGIVHTVLFLIILYFKDPSDLSLSNIKSLVASSLGAMLTGVLGEDALPGYLSRLLGWVDIFRIWKIALLAIGYSAVSRKLTTARAATWIVAIYVVIALIGSAIPPGLGLG